MALSTDFTHRSNVLLAPQNTGSLQAVFAAGYFVTGYSEGGIVKTSTTSTIVQLHSEHAKRFSPGFSKVIVITPGADYSTVDPPFLLVTGVDLNNDRITLESELTVYVGDLVVNLATDAGVNTPDYDASNVNMYSSPSADLPVTNKTLTTDSQGAYSYWYDEDEIWEVVRDPADRLATVITQVNRTRISAKVLEVQTQFTPPNYTTDARDTQTAGSGFPSGTLIFNSTQGLLNVYNLSAGRWEHVDGTDAT